MLYKYEIQHSSFYNRIFVVLFFAKIHQLYFSQWQFTVDTIGDTECYESEFESAFQ